MKKIKNFLSNMLTNTDPNIWGYVMLNDKINKR